MRSSSSREADVLSFSLSEEKALLQWSLVMKNIKKLLIGLFMVFVLAGSLASFSLVLADEEKSCAPPYKPSNVIKVMFNFSEGMDYISTADSACSDLFAEELIETFRDSIWVTEGCLDATIKDVEEAKAKRKDRLSA